MNRKICIICLVCSVGLLSLFAQTTERVYLQTDKQLYMSGELLWLKMYTTDVSGKLMSLSKIGYVELVRDSIPEVQIKVDIPDGVGSGWMELPAMLPTGYYRIIAYTRNMRNESEYVFFEKTIAIINPFHQNEILYSDETNTPFLFQPLEKDNPSIALSINKSSYTKRDKGTISIKNLPAENISIGISIAGIDPALTVNPTIGEWKAHIAANKTPVVDRRYIPEYEGAIIDGVMVDLATGNPVVDPLAIPMLSFPGKEIQLFVGQPFTDGAIAFYTQCTTGKQELTTTAIVPSDKKYRIDMLSPYALHKSVDVPLLKPDSAWLNYLQLRNLSVQVTHAYLSDSLSIIREIPSCTDFFPQMRYILDDYTRFPNMEEVFIEFITGAGIRRTNEGRRFSMWNDQLGNYSTNILVLLDNIPVVNHELMTTYNPLLVKTIDMHFGQYVFGGHAFDGIIAFYTYKNDYSGITFGESTQIFDFEGTQPYRYFYAPNYEATGVDSPMPDFRHTLLWEPLIQSAGQTELTIPFTTSDMPGSYVITIEGIGENGTVIQAKQTFDVEIPNDILYKASPIRETVALIPPETGMTDTTSNKAVTPFIAAPVTKPVVATPVPEAVSDTIITNLVPTPVPDTAMITPVMAQTTTNPVVTVSSQTATTSMDNNVLARVKVEVGQRLTLIAEKYYGNKVFWVYIYEYNKAKIGSNPSRILPGIELMIPAKVLYGIDENSAASIEKATLMQGQLLGGTNN